MSIHLKKDPDESTSYVACTLDVRSSTANGCSVKHLNLTSADLGSRKYRGLAPFFIREVSIQTTHKRTHWVKGIGEHAHPPAT